MLFPYKRKGKMGLALSSGAAHGLAHIGVLKVMEKNGINFDYICGSSVGAIIGALWAEGYTSGEIYQIAKRMNWKKIVKITIPKRGFFSIEGLEKIIKEYIPHNRFGGLKKKFGCVATSLKSEKPIYFTEGDLAKKIAASCAIPVIFKPIQINGEYCIDGGFIENTPATLARTLGADSVVGVRLNKHYQFTTKPDSIIKILLQTIKIMSPSEKFSKYIDRGDVVINPKIREIDYDGLDRIDKLVELGKQAAQQKIKNINGKFLLKKDR
ncbi:MAG: patatin-like phospholipase family protein [Candidatus Mcinerneyibacterium aminivorans]|uniref:Patatin-like phospholipase family protein n=1 Tax=Candidatus Mcinerneyibacterium aminivorans TaxID=2703815 RepID=A0A5D0MJI7_9BACT|nr:MAG: patatin-like phospholipase family protein [Candidatus Mcinerneyibacterium aminivorans]